MKGDNSKIWFAITLIIVFGLIAIAGIISKFYMIDKSLLDKADRVCKDRFIICYYSLEGFDGDYSSCDTYTIGREQEWGIPKIEYECDGKFCSKTIIWSVCEIK